MLPVLSLLDAEAARATETIADLRSQASQDELRDPGRLRTALLKVQGLAVAGLAIAAGEVIGLFTIEGVVAVGSRRIRGVIWRCSW